ncbi:DUF2207 domain-containing protein [Tolypothrix sp. FACHB-123]|uniref:DUF2207 domain-containing protein n=1 Tax=Tolypothrix sp. FACHB-123 TaxID=2692868 RepID=UPI001683C666|nr:DUF2207 domain-containing protein [Tolypothrix sp. FACHB-123]MBD2353267.1 DUF2207 domain-containing protein [Tolypothrix sp. FACHB-123]
MSRKLIQRLILFCITLIFCLTFSLDHVQAESVPFYWDFINVDVAVQTNGDMLVTETQKYTFTADYTNQRYRYILIDKIDEIHEVTVSENGQIFPSATKIENNQFWINWEHPLTAPGSHTFVLKYRVVGGLEVNENDAQVYWKAIFPERQAAVKQAKVTVRFPEQFATKIKAFQTWGTEANIRKVDTQTIEAIASTAIEPGKELGVQVNFDSTGTDIKPSRWQSSGSSSSSGNWFAWIFWGFFGLIFLYGIIFGSHSSSGSGGSGGGGSCGGGGGCGGGGCGGGGCGGGG